MVPNGWSLKLISDTAKVITGNTPSTKDSSYYNGDIPFVSPADLGANKLISSANKTLTKKGFEKSRAVRKGSTLFTCIGSTIGKLGQANCELATNQQINAVIPYSSFDDDFIYYQLEMRAKFISKLAGTQAVPIINKTTFESQNLLVPDSLPEQRKIAQILSTWDRGIATTEKLIDASKQQKKALMQQLLTGKKRLVDPETGKAFEGDWEEVKLDDLALYRRGSFPQPYGNPEWVDEVNGYPFIQVFDIDKNMKLKKATKTKISDAAIDKSVFIEAGTVIVSLQGSIGRVAITQYDAYVDRTVLLFQSFKRKMDTIYFAYAIQELFEIEKEKAPGGTIKTITKQVLSNFTIKVPTHYEQQKIASVLTAADKEIELLGTKLAHLKQEKKALMQQLLTGKRRVKVAETEAA
ncbi:restriction endonuclease subunit S [Vibrio parahaemolyticus]|uniref:restriction endonuclease subunit S n=1 Tax=Vibrio parahaemolyticus TaxID=670 RepID=UPI001A8E0E65|nr:restriction endonuclease subunit S [Vibrio parahaemolyticus]MDF5543514.1 restriction endonuclease subunit S [Vibrio parahaemolyticus]